MPDKAREQGRALRESFELRLLADYDAGATGLAERARASLAAAASFVAFATSLIDKPKPRSERQLEIDGDMGVAMKLRSILH